MTKNFTIRLATEEDTDKVLSLMRKCFGERDFMNRAWYNWFNFGCPNGFNRNYIAIDRATDKLVGGYGLLPIQIMFNGEIANGSLCTNVMTHPDYAGRGIFTHMGKHCLAAEKTFQSKYTLGIPNQSAYPGHMKIGWETLSDLVFVAKQSFRDKRYKAREVSAFDTGVDEVVKQIAQKTNFMVYKDHRFLNWRYSQRPQHRYRLFIFERKGVAEGYMVLKYFDADGRKKTHILDIMAINEEALEDLVSAAEQCAIGQDELNCWQVKGSIYEELFSNNQFTPTSERNVLIMHKNYGKKAELESSNWWFALGDNDVY